jgi:NADH:ubiquinone oxidoreductase subunit 3 (subunit A)
MQKVLAVTSICFSALTWLGLLLMYTWALTEPGITLVLLLAAGAFVWALVAVVIYLLGRRWRRSEAKVEWAGIRE